MFQCSSSEEILNLNCFLSSLKLSASTSIPFQLELKQRQKMLFFFLPRFSLKHTWTVYHYLYTFYHSLEARCWLLVEKSAVHDTMIDGLLFINKLPFLPPHLHVVMAGAQSDNVVLIPELSTSQQRKFFCFLFCRFYPLVKMRDVLEPGHYCNYIPQLAECPSQSPGFTFRRLRL